MARSSSRPSPFKRSIRALTPEPPAGEPPASSGDGAPAPETSASATNASPAHGSSASVPTVHAPSTAGATTRRGVPVVAGEAVSTRRPMAGPGPMAFQPLQDDSLRKGRKFLGLHKGLLTTPGRSAAALARTYAKPLLLIVLIAAIGFGGYIGVTELQKYFSSEEAKRRQARDDAIAAGSWEELSRYAKEYGPEAAQEGNFRDALEVAYQQRVDQLFQQAVEALGNGDPDAWSRLQTQLGNLSTGWAELTGEDLPQELADHVELQVTQFRREALVNLQNGVRTAAMNAEASIGNGEIRAGMDAWRRDRTSWEGLAEALEVPAEDIPQFHETIRDAHRGVLRAAFNALQARLRQQYDQALVGVSDDPTALNEFEALRQSVIDEAREYGLSEQDLMDLGRDAARYADDISRQVRVQFDQQLQAAGATATQQIASPDVSLRTAIENWRLAADQVAANAQTVGISDDSSARLQEQRQRIEEDLRRRVVKVARENADVEELKSLRELYLDQPEALAEFDKLITAALIRQGNFDGAEEFSSGPARIVSLFGAALHDYWVKDEPQQAAERFGRIFADESMDQIRETGELDNLLAISGAWQMVIANANRNRRAVREALTSVVRITPDIESPTWSLETFSIAYFQMLRDDFSGASLLFQRVQDKVPAGYPLDYLSTVANVRAGRTPLTDDLLASRETIAGQDLNKLYLLRYATEVEQKARVYDARAMRAIDQLIETGQLASLVPALNHDAGLKLDADEIRFTVGAIRYFYYYQRSSGFARMRQVQAQPFRRATDLLHQWHNAWLPTSTADELNPETIRVRLDALDQALPTGEGKWPLEMVRALILFQKVYRLDDQSSLKSATSAFERLGELKPVLEPMALTYRGRLTLWQSPAAAEALFRRALDRVPGSAEARRFLADAVVANDPESFQLDLLLAAAGQGSGVSVPYPLAIYELADPHNGLEVNHGYWRDRYAAWHANADDIARREFPPVPAASRGSSNDGGNSGREAVPGGDGNDGRPDRDRESEDSSLPREGERPDQPVQPDDRQPQPEDGNSSFGPRESEPVNGDGGPIRRQNLNAEDLHRHRLPDHDQRDRLRDLANNLTR